MSITFIRVFEIEAAFQSGMTRGYNHAASADALGFSDDTDPDVPEQYTPYAVHFLGGWQTGQDNWRQDVRANVSAGF